jgi:hypothetical protein
VQFQDAAAARLLVQSVDVLGNHGNDFPGSFQTGQGTMPVIRLRTFQLVVALPLHSPVLTASVRTVQEILEQDWLIPAPDPAGAPEIGNAAFRANARPGEGYRMAGFGQEMGDLCNGVVITGHCTFIP